MYTPGTNIERGTADRHHSLLLQHLIHRFHRTNLLPNCIHWAERHGWNWAAGQRITTQSMNFFHSLFIPIHSPDLYARYEHGREKQRTVIIIFYSKDRYIDSDARISIPTGFYLSIPFIDPIYTDLPFLWQLWASDMTLEVPHSTTTATRCPHLWPKECYWAGSSKSLLNTHYHRRIAGVRAWSWTLRRRLVDGIYQ